jgi:hypothetical protein
MYVLNFLVLTNIVTLIVVAYECDHTSLSFVEPHGIGVIARRNFIKGEEIEHPLVISVPQLSIMKTVLFDYTMKSRKGYSDIILGYSMVYNHHPTKPSIGIPFVNGSFRVIAERNITAGKEMFFTYGKRYFSERGVRESSGRLLSPIPGCPYSLTRKHGFGLLASQFIQQGTVIEVARGLVVPGIRTMFTNMEPFVWYRERTNLGSMLLLGNGAYYAPAIDPVDANVHYQWFSDPNNDDGKIKCHEQMLISFTAVRDIEEGELLMVPITVEPIPSQHPSTGSASIRYRKRIIDSYLDVHCF